MKNFISHFRDDRPLSCVIQPRLHTDPDSRQTVFDDGGWTDVSAFAHAIFDVPVYISREVGALCAAMQSTDVFRQNFRIKSLLVQSKIAIRNADTELTGLSFEVKLRALDAVSDYDRHRLYAMVNTDGRDPMLMLMLMMDSQHADMKEDGCD